MRASKYRRHGRGKKCGRALYTTHPKTEFEQMGDHSPINHHTTNAMKKHKRDPKDTEKHERDPKDIAKTQTGSQLFRKAQTGTTKTLGSSSVDY